MLRLPYELADATTAFAPAELSVFRSFFSEQGVAVR